MELHRSAVKLVKQFRGQDLSGGAPNQARSRVKQRTSSHSLDSHLGGLSRTDCLHVRSHDLAYRMMFFRPPIGSGYLARSLRETRQNRRRGSLLASLRHGPQPRAPELAIDPAFRAKGAGEANAPTIAFSASLHLMPTAHSQGLITEGGLPPRYPGAVRPMPSTHCKRRLKG